MGGVLNGVDDQDMAHRFVRAFRQLGRDKPVEGDPNVPFLLGPAMTVKAAKADDPKRWASMSARYDGGYPIFRGDIDLTNAGRQDEYGRVDFWIDRQAMCVTLDVIERVLGTPSVIEKYPSTPGVYFGQHIDKIKEDDKEINVYAAAYGLGNVGARHATEEINVKFIYKRCADSLIKFMNDPYEMWRKVK